MDYGFYEEYGTPFSGRKLRKLREFLQAAELDYDEQIEYTVNLTGPPFGCGGGGNAFRAVG